MPPASGGPISFRAAASPAQTRAPAVTRELTKELVPDGRLV